jgi:taurine dioxygenase
MPIDILTVRSGFVAELTDSGGVGSLDADLLRRTAVEHGVVVIRNLVLDPFELVELTQYLGPVEVVWDVFNRHPQTDYVQVLSNEGRTPAVGADRWHTDRSFMFKPTRHTILHPFVLPAAGGDTLFADTKAAYQALPSDVQERRAMCVGVHTYEAIGSMRAEAHGDQFESAYADAFNAVRHPVVRAHPETGEPSLYVNALTLNRVETIDGDLVDVNLEQLYEHATGDRFLHRHKWRAGDVVIWDNACVMHRATALAPDQRRVLYRTTTAGDSPRPLRPSLEVCEAQSATDRDHT